MTKHTTTTDTTATFYVMCRVSGGVTGTREALLKANGIVQTFPTRAAADAEAKRLRDKMNGPYAVAFFQYWSVDESQAAFVSF